MRLTSFRVKSFRNILDSGDIPVESDVTCLVGKNESGKTALLQALYRANPARPTPFDLEDQYPRWLLSRHRKRGVTQQARPIQVSFELDDEDVAAVNEALGADVVTARSFTVDRDYDGKAWWSLPLNQEKAVAGALEAAQVGNELRQEIGAAKDIVELKQAAKRVVAETGGAETDRVEEAQRLTQTLDERYGEEELFQAASTLLGPRMPRFFYFSNYSMLPGRVDIRDVPSSADVGAADGLQTARALLELAGTDMERIEEDEYEARKAELEAVSDDLTREVFEYWQQNRELELSIDVDKETVGAGPNRTAVARFLDIRVRDRRHGFTNNFGQRSSGFQWFFSFLAAFSEFDEQDHPVIVLLDEPALTLHGRAQADFLRFIDERLGATHQVIYTTHSPFMVEPGRLERVRVVEDRGPDEGGRFEQLFERLNATFTP